MIHIKGTRRDNRGKLIYIDVSGHLSRIKCRSSPSPTDSCANLASVMQSSNKRKLDADLK